MYVSIPIPSDEESAKIGSKLVSGTPSELATEAVVCAAVGVATLLMPEVVAGTLLTVSLVKAIASIWKKFNPSGEQEPPLYRKYSFTPLDTSFLQQMYPELKVHPDTDLDLIKTADGWLLEFDIIDPGYPDAHGRAILDVLVTQDEDNGRIIAVQRK